MKYAKPEIAVLDNAVRAVRGQMKGILTFVDFGGPAGPPDQPPWNSQPAYEADE